MHEIYLVRGGRTELVIGNREREKERARGEAQEQIS
jgi:hypothetical protein